MDLDEIYVQIESKLVDPPEFGSPGTMELRVLSLDAENGTGITNVPVDFAVWHTSRFAVADMWVPTNAAGVTQKAFDPAAPQYQIILRMDGAAQSWAMPTPNTAPPSISNNFQIGVRNYKLEGLVPEPFAGGALVLVLAVLAWRRS
jgi:hypothetical protein